MDIDNVIKEAQDLLSKNSEWRNRYKGYAEAFIANEEVISSNKRRFNELSPLYFYISTTKIKEAKNNLLLDVRYRGRSVATLKVAQDSITLSTKDKNTNNKSVFECEFELDNVPWLDKKATAFKSFFINYTPSINKKGIDGECNLESLLLTEFSGKGKQIKKIKPVRYQGIRFGMPTPLGASDHKKLKYSGFRGGEIDILARTGRGRATYLTVIEVKDENKQNEPPKDALKQAIKYAVFIRELLRSESGKDWYKIFGFKGNIPKKLTIRVACAMRDDFPDKSFTKQEFNVGDDIIECHYIYFKYDKKLGVSDFQTSLN